MRDTARAAALFSIVAVLATAASAESLRPLKGKEIAARFSGQELTDEVHWAYVFERGGRLRSFSMGKAGTGRWRVEKDQLCFGVGQEEPRCYAVWMSGSRVELRREGDLPEEGVLQKPKPRAR